jgi:prepilin-type N-terminal cleavage/methylation domain-containing protein
MCQAVTSIAPQSARKVTSPRLGASAEHGFTVIEVVIAVALISIGVASTIRVFGASSRATVRSEQSEVGLQQAQAELDKLKTLPYGSLALTSQPASSSDPKDPGSKVEGAALRVRSDLIEPFVLTPGAGQAATVDPGPHPFSVGSQRTPITGRVYRFVTWRDEKCPNLLCDGGQNTKRLTVAVAVDPTGGSEARAPAWLSTVVVDPDAAPPGTQAPPGGGPGSGEPVTAQSFYLYDTPCGASQRQDQTGNHPTRDTASAGTSPSETSVCENPDPGRQPDLMAATSPPGDSATPLFAYSSDLEGDYPGGLAMRHAGTECRSSYPAAAAADPSAAGKWTVHAWSTGKLTQTFHLNGLATLSLFTVSLGGTSGPRKLCATLIDREVTSGMPTDRTLGSAVYDLSSWPVTIRRITFSFNLPQETDVLANHRLMLALQLRGESGGDVALIYDHPLYPSLLEVATSTPL